MNAPAPFSTICRFLCSLSPPFTLHAEFCHTYLPRAHHPIFLLRPGVALTSMHTTRDDRLVVIVCGYRRIILYF